eukprot:331183-Chlamydomonas_euryale.AAC.1
MAVHGGAWRCMAVHGGTWRCMAARGGAWRCMAEGTRGFVQHSRFCAALEEAKHKGSQDIEDGLPPFTTFHHRSSPFPGTFLWPGLWRS